MEISRDQPQTEHGVVELTDDEVDPPISGAALSDHEGVELTDDEVDPPISGAALSDHEGV